MYRKLIGGLASTSLIAGLVTAGAVAGAVATATPALGAGSDVNLGVVDSRISDNYGTDANGNGQVTANNCLTYAPTGGSGSSATSTNWVVSPGEARAGHGTKTGTCPSTLSTDIQSVIGFRPTATSTVQTGKAFLLGQITHYNQPISVNSRYFKGNVNLRLGGPGQTFVFPYLLDETPNTATPETNPINDDILNITTQISSVITVGGFQYRLVADGFVQSADAFLNGTCRAEPPTGATVNNKFVTTETKTTKGCLYGTLTQVRTLKLVKKVQWDPNVSAPASIPESSFASTSSLQGSPWQTSPIKLTPPKSNGGSAQYPPLPSTGNQLLAMGETVTLTENTPGSAWELTGIQCSDSAGAVGTVDVAGRKATLADVPEATTTAQLPITCEFTNTYTRSQLTLAKDWGANAVPGDKADLKIQGGITNPATVTSTAPVNGTKVSTDAQWGSAITVSEDFRAGNINSYDKSLKCVKAGTTDEVAGSADGTFTMPKYPVTCTYTNDGKPLQPGIDVVKKADPAGPVKPGTEVTYTYTVKNTGDTPLLKVAVTDDKCAPVEYTSGDTNSDSKLDITETWIFTCKAILNETTKNVATATGEDSLGQKVEDTDTVTVIVPKPGIKVLKAASAAQVNPGQSVTYTYTVSNTGDIELLKVTVTDDKCAPVEYKSGDTNNDSALQLDETWVFECTTVLTVATTNTAIATGEDKTGQEVTAQATLTVPVVSPVVAKRICPIDVTLHKPTPKKVGGSTFTNKIKTKKSSCVLLKPVVLCRPIAASAAGETAFCDTKVTKKGRITVKTKGYEAVRVTVLVRTKPKPGFFDQWKPNTWRKSWKLK